MKEGPVLRHLALLSAAAAAFALLAGGSAQATGTLTESAYANGQTYQINTGAAVVFDASPGLLRTASPIFIIGFPVAAGTTGPITLPSGYQPQNNGLPSPIPYHDHVLVSVRGPGYSAPLRVVQMQYTTSYAYSPSFVPITSFEQLVAAEAAGGVFEVVNPGAADPYELWTTTVLIRPLVS